MPLTCLSNRIRDWGAIPDFGSASQENPPSSTARKRRGNDVRSDDDDISLHAFPSRVIPTVYSAVQLIVVVAIVAYYGLETLARGKIPGVADVRGENR